MNIISASIAPLPDALSRPRLNGNGRRHLIGQHDIDPGILQHFNDLLAQIDFDHEALDRDQLASAARELVDRRVDARSANAAAPTDGIAPPCIRQRMRRAGAIDLMLSDPEWEPPALPAFAAKVVVDYIRGSVTLVPNTLPVVGRLDDAVMVETAWPRAAAEVRDYLDFCRLRRIEAELRRETRLHFGFTRDQWSAARQAEAGWIAHCQRVATSTYLPAGSSRMFRVN